MLIDGTSYSKQRISHWLLICFQTKLLLILDSFLRWMKMNSLRRPNNSLEFKIIGMKLSLSILRELMWPRWLGELQEIPIQELALEVIWRERSQRSWMMLKFGISQTVMTTSNQWKSNLSNLKMASNQIDHHLKEAWFQPIKKQKKWRWLDILSKQPHLSEETKEGSEVISTH